MFKELRRRANLTQSEVAKRLNVSEATISLYEAGARKPPIDKVKEIAVALNATTDEVLECFSK